MVEGQPWELDILIERAEEDLNQLEENDIEELARFIESDDEEIQEKALGAAYAISRKDPVLLLPATSTILSTYEDESERSDVRLLCWKIINIIKRNPTVQNLIHQLQNDEESAPKSALQDMRAKSLAAKSSTVTKERLEGRERYFYDVTKFIKPDEQPHFLFALSHSWAITDSPIVVNKGGQDQPLTERNTTGSILISDYGIRILSEGGRWNISYSDITGADTNRRPTPTLEVMASGDIFKFRVAKSIHDMSQVSNAAKLIEDVVYSNP